MLRMTNIYLIIYNNFLHLNEINRDHKTQVSKYENALNNYLNLFLQSYKNSLEIMPQKSGSLGTFIEYIC